ncbi:MAG TPA: hypothetical protein VFY05_01635 [Candidatus Angelobacter sp.]|nr:hypothetical protein [Candidatus Angelobacter sp.]
MSANLYIRSSLLAVLLSLAAGMLPAPATAQAVVQAPASQVLLDQAYSAMYNLNFDQAFRDAEQAKAMAKDDPLPWVAEACAALFREFNRYNILRSDLFASDDAFDARKPHAWNPADRQQFENALNGAKKIAQERLARNKNDAKALFSLALVNGLQADDSALLAKKDMAALSFTKTANGYAERLLARVPNYYDAYVATGMGKYIIGGKSAPIRWLLRLDGLKGDQAEGVHELSLAAAHGHYLAPFAKVLLAFNDLRHHNKNAARAKLEDLHAQFPNNPLFTRELAKLEKPAAGPGQ